MIVETKYGKLEGACEYSCIVFKGVPFAEPPIGKNRFKRPQKLVPWDGVRKALTWGNKSIQRTQQKGSFYQKEFYNDEKFSADSSEDCLYLNIWLPLGIEKQIEDGNKLPVAVYVHGGAFMGGAGSNLPFVATKLVEEGVIVVTINYRLGVWGFFSHPILAELSGDGTLGNLGLWDQIEAIKWVKENISSFGGDSENITLFAQSAGAMSLQILALSDETKGLYNRMILQSGGGYKNPLAIYRTVDEAGKYGDWFIEELSRKYGISKDDSCALKNLLMTAKSEDIQEIAGNVVGRSFKEGSGFCYVPVVDNLILKDDGNKLIKDKKFHKTEYILGANKNDITMDDATSFDASDNPMEMANIDFAKMANDSGSDSYVYYFEHPLPGDESGAFHSAELWYVFGSLDYSWRKEHFTSKDYELSDQMVKYWTNFMKTGNPNAYGLPSWNKCTSSDSFVKSFS